MSSEEIDQSSELFTMTERELKQKTRKPSIDIKPETISSEPSDNMDSNEKQSPISCFVCDSLLVAENAFYDFMHVIESPSAISVKDVIGKFLELEKFQEQLQSTVTCSGCFHLLGKFDEAERRFLEMQDLILDIIQPCCNKYGYIVQEALKSRYNEARNTDTTVYMVVEPTVEMNEDSSSDHFGLHEASDAADSDYAPAPPKLKIKLTNKGRGMTRGRGRPRGRPRGRGSNDNKSQKAEQILAQSKLPKKKRLLNFSCQKCGKIFQKAAHLKRHELQHKGSKPYQCNLCERQFRSKSGAEFHALKQHHQSEGVISIINEENEEIKVDDEDAENEEGEKEDPTEDQDGSKEEMGDTFDVENIGWRGDDFEWKLEEDDKKKLAKEKNKGKAKRLKKQERPRKLIPKGLVRTFPCTQCGKSYRTPSELETHRLLHSGERPFICEICGQAYKQKHALEVHVEMHRGQNRFQCHICQKSFTQKCGLQRHLPMHTGECPYQCDICGKRFLFHSSFSVHKLTHSGEKPHKCPQCGSAFMSASHLKRHLRVHSGEKPHRCQICCKAFAEKYNLEAHVRIHTGTKLHRCLVCGAGYDRRVRFEEHMASHITDGPHSAEIDSMPSSPPSAPSLPASAATSALITAFPPFTTVLPTTTSHDNQITISFS